MRYLVIILLSLMIVSCGSDDIRSAHYIDLDNPEWRVKELKRIYRLSDKNGRLQKHTYSGRLDQIKIEQTHTTQGLILIELNRIESEKEGE